MDERERHRARWSKRVAVLALLLGATSLATPSAVAAPGDIDPDFGTGGKVVTDFGGGESAGALLLQPDGKLVAAGGGDGDFLVARYNSDGTLDGSFGSGGKVVVDFFGDRDEASSAVLLADGKILVGGSAAQPADDLGIGVPPAVGDRTDFALARLNSDGSLDASFGTGGLLVTDFFGLFDAVAAVLVQPDGRVVAGGTATKTTSGGDPHDFALARYNVDGSLDGSFDGDGRVVTDFVGTQDLLSSLVRQPDGAVVAAGSVRLGDSFDVALARYGVTGSLDGSFGTGGRLTVDLAGSSNTAADAVLLPDGKLVVAGRAERPGTGDDFALARFTSTGMLDPSFGAGGWVTTDFSGNRDGASALALQPDGKLVASGTVGIFNPTPPGRNFGTARYNADGSLDVSFNGDGKITTDFNGGFDSAADVGVQPDGKVVVAGLAVQDSSTTGADFGLARYGTTDADGDGLTDAQEADLGTNPIAADSDSDGLTDGQEVALGTNPTVADSDNDGVNDGQELASGTNPTDPDSDDDGIPDGSDVEAVQSTVSGLPDSSLGGPSAHGKRTAITSALDQVEAAVRDGDTATALSRLRSLRHHLDGCGTVADRNDWVSDCSDQLEIRALVDLLIANLS